MAAGKRRAKPSPKRPPRRFDELGEQQQAILEILWERGEATVQDVRDHLGRARPPAYTTVLSLLQKLERTGWVTHRADGRSYIYKPRVSHERERTRSLRAFVDRLFGGDPAQLFEHLIDDPRISADDVTRIREMIQRKRQEDES